MGRGRNGKGGTMTMNLEGKVALVTGASKGVGKGIALELARQGCSVVVNYHSDEGGAAATVHEIQALGQKAVAVKANVGIAVEVDAMFAAAESRAQRSEEHTSELQSHLNLV